MPSLISDSLWRLFWISLIVKLGLALFIPLVSDEYYYWLWGQYPQLSYFDHPPMVGWIMILADPLAAIGAGAIRWPFVFMSQATIWIWLMISKSFLRARERQWLLWTLLLNPMTGWGGLIATPDIPLLFFWSLSLWLCQQLVRKPTPKTYGLLGASLGLGFLSKYMVVVFLPCLALWIVLEKHWKYALSLKILWTVSLGLLFSLPVLYWNFEHQWVSFLFQWGHGTQGGPTQWKWPVEYLTSQVFIIFPIFVYFALKNMRKNGLLFVFGFFPIAFFFITSFSARVEANWPLMALPAIYALSLIELKATKATVGTLIFWSLTLVTVLSSLLWYSQTLNDKYPLKIFEAESYQDMMPLTDSPLPVFVDNYQKASYLSFQTHSLICKLPGIGRPDFFSFLESCKELPAEFLFVTEVTSKPDFSRAYPNYEIKGAVSENSKFVSYRVGLK